MSFPQKLTYPVIPGSKALPPPIGPYDLAVREILDEAMGYANGDVHKAWLVLWRAANWAGQHAGNLVHFRDANDVDANDVDYQPISHAEVNFHDVVIDLANLALDIACRFEDDYFLGYAAAWWLLDQAAAYAVWLLAGPPPYPQALDRGHH
jgi:hypothetical protein